MKNTFHGWAGVGKMNIDLVSDLIVTGRKASEAIPDTWIFPYLGTQTQALVLLDFGCGFGRNSFGFAKYSNLWSVTGYDNEAMLSRVQEYSKIKYDGKIPENLQFVSIWETLKDKSFDCISCTIVLQHIYEDALAKYSRDFKKMTKRLVVSGRRFNDQRQRSTWSILEENGLIPSEFYNGNGKISYSPEGDPNEHNMAIYRFE